MNSRDAYLGLSVSFQLSVSSPVSLRLSVSPSLSPSLRLSVSLCLLLSSVSGEAMVIPQLSQESRNYIVGLATELQNFNTTRICLDMVQVRTTQPLYFPN